MTALIIGQPRWHYPNGDSYGHYASHVRGLTCPFSAYEVDGGVWIDHSIVDLIVGLNELGYITTFCCSGLISEHRGSHDAPWGYVSFTGRRPPDIPFYFKPDGPRTRDELDGTVIRTPSPVRYVVNEDEKVAAWAQWTRTVAQKLATREVAA